MSLLKTWWSGTAQEQGGDGEEKQSDAGEETGKAEDQENSWVVKGFGGTKAKLTGLYPSSYRLSSYWDVGKACGLVDIFKLAVFPEANSCCDICRPDDQCEWLC